MRGRARSTKEKILLAAERLIAEHGVDGVSMRQIGAAVGSGNNSAVLYHFGSKEKLVQAIFEYRLPRLRERRAQLIAERQPANLPLLPDRPTPTGSTGRCSCERHQGAATCLSI